MQGGVLSKTHFDCTSFAQSPHGAAEEVCVCVCVVMLSCLFAHVCTYIVLVLAQAHSTLHFRLTHGQ